MRTGIDIIQIDRISLDAKFISKIANEKEIEYLNSYKKDQSRKESLAGLWAVKEASFKALGLGKDSGVVFKNVELYHEESGRPYIKLNGIALEKFIELKLKQIEVSISHSEKNAIAIVIMK